MRFRFFRKFAMMKLEEAIVYLLASAGYGMKIGQIAKELNVSEKQVYAVIMAHPETFVKSEGRIRLMI
jgi:predicted DNA-binding transcriptional regulator